MLLYRMSLVASRNPRKLPGLDVEADVEGLGQGIRIRSERLFFERCLCKTQVQAVKEKNGVSACLLSMRSSIG
jgi:hypothetical protein